VVRGSRKPAWKLVPPARDRSAGRQAIELMRELDMPGDPWQEDVALAGMGRDRAGRWTADSVLELVSRQNGKTWPLFARLLWGLTKGGERKALWSAHEFKTSGESFLDLQAICEHPRMAKEGPKFTTANGKEGIRFANGARVLVIARSKTSGRGFGSDLLILDEAFALTDHQMASLLPALSARDAPQAWYASSAPMLDSAVLRRLCLAARRGEADRTVYLEWCAEADDDPEDPRTWAKANPAFGVRIPERAIRGELDKLSPEDFARERLGIWREEDVVSVFPPGTWASCATHGERPPEDAPRAIAVDVAPDRSRAAIGAAGQLADGRMLVQVIKASEGVSWVVDAVATLDAAHSPAAVVVDGAGQSQTLIAPLEKAGVEVTRTDAREMVAACGSFFDRVTEGRLAHLDQTELTAAVEGAKQRELGDGWAWHRRRSGVDITPLVACTLAAHGVETAKPERPAIFVL
jgi:phage terminase large subunit-like protein